MGSLFEYRKEMDQLHFTPEEKTVMVAQLLEATKEQNMNQTMKTNPNTEAKHRHFRWQTGIAAAALAGVVLVGAAGATGMLKSVPEAFEGILGGAAAETEIINKIGRPIGASAKSNGLTVTADAIVGDKYSVCVVYTLTADDPGLWENLSGQNETGYLSLMFERDDMDLGLMGGSNGSSYFIDQVPGDNEIQYVQQITQDRPLKSGAAAKVEFRNLKGIRTGTEQDTCDVLVEGNWQLKFDLNFEDASVTLPAGDTFRQYDMNYTIDELTVSPLGIVVNYTVDREIQWSNAGSGKSNPADAEQEKRFLQNIPVLLTKTDGTVVRLSNSGGSIARGEGETICSKNLTFDEIVDLDEITSVSVGGISYYLH